MSSKHRRYSLTIGIILLLTGLSVAPGIGLPTTITPDDLVQVTMQTYGPSEKTNHAVLLTKQQLTEVQQVFDTLKERLSTTDSLRETHQIFNDTIDDLQAYNLFPQEFTTQQLKRLVTSASAYQKIAPLLQRTSRKLQSTATEGEIQDFFCSVAGNSSNTHTAKLAKRIAHRLYVIMDHSSENALLVKVATAFWIVFHQISKITQKMVTQNGTHYGVSIYFGNYHYYPYPDWLYPAEGWISTHSTKGVQNITGTFWGQIIAGGWQPQDDWYMNYTWKGCLGFSGLIIYTGVDTAYFLGSALQVHVGPNRP